MHRQPNIKHVTGAWGEDIAVVWLQKQGFRIICRNWRKGSYELDIVCVQQDELVFVEVKTRAAGSLESAREALSLAKQKSLIRAAQEYIKANNAWELACRFDLVCVESLETGHNLEHLSNVFELSKSNLPGRGSSGRSYGGSNGGSYGGNKGGGSSLDSGNTHWQPW